MLFKLKKIIKDILYISKLTKTNNKKLTIIFSVFLAQALAALDILIILNFSYILTNTFSISESLNFVVALFEVKAFLPLIVILRLICSVSQNLILKKLELTIQQNLKIYFLNQAFTKRNYSNSDIFYFINKLSDHISFFYSSFASFLNYLLQILAFTSYLFLNDTSTISFLFLGISLLFYPIYKLIKLSREYMDKAYHFGLEVNKDIEKVVENTFFIKLLNKEREELDRFSNLVKSLNVNYYKNNKYSILINFVPSFATLMLLSIITIYFSRFFNVSLEFVGITLRLFQSLSNLSGSLNKISNSHVHLTKFYEIEQYNPLFNSEGFMLNNSIENELAVNFYNVNFSYANSEEVIFKNLNFSIKKNQKVIVKGLNGSGKSTLLGLITGVFTPSSGTVTVSSKKFSYVGPRPLIFDTTLLDNLTYGLENPVSNSKIVRLINELKVFDNFLENKLNETINNRVLSSGQMQKIAFIRAFLNNPEILILDESTSNLDLNSKEVIYKKLKQMEVTIINSTHEDQFKEFFDKVIKIEIINGERKLIEQK